ncbi:hypothetical protein J3Q64DRAFT_1733600 [Phycomyces blakesleeanus]|uniref:Globin domain-containing protein n=1 Tax=Phycomyces blakesleeanus TaxID=4837 RepID=A0ABR3B223_PHYBL
MRAISGDQQPDQQDQEFEVEIESEAEEREEIVEDQGQEDQEEEEWFDSDHMAAIKIQSAWRGYWARKSIRTRNPNTLGAELVLGVVRLCGSVHQRQMKAMTRRLENLERRLREETAMRTEFEKAVADMTVLIDSQQKALCERVEQEVAMRETYEHKIELALLHIGPLEDQLRAETDARVAMEDRIERVLDQMAELGQVQVNQELEAAESRKLMQAQIDSLQQMQDLKTNQQQQQQQQQQKQSIQQPAQVQMHQKTLTSVSKPRLVSSRIAPKTSVTSSGISVKPRRTLVPPSLPPLKAGHLNTKPNVSGTSTVTNAARKTNSRR